MGTQFVPCNTCPVGHEHVTLFAVTIALHWSGVKYLAQGVVPFKSMVLPCPSGTQVKGLVGLGPEPPPVLELGFLSTKNRVTPIAARATTVPTEAPTMVFCLGVRGMFLVLTPHFC
jgi:hypothetical protein